MPEVAHVVSLNVGTDPVHRPQQRALAFPIDSVAIDPHRVSQ